VPLPTGTVTFAFTDIEGSTARWERDRAAMQDAVRRHDALMRAAIAAHDGVVFKTIGDAFCAAFARPEDAVGAMLDAQRALAAEDFSAVDGLRVRAAIHTGTTDERDGDYFGPAVNRVARLLAIGHGSQVLVSGVTADLVQGDLPSQASLRDLGEHRLRDLARPEYVYQLVAPDLAAEFPALRSLDVLPNNLPRMLTSFVGREAEIAEIAALIDTNPLVTLVGSGGVGRRAPRCKSRPICSTARATASGLSSSLRSRAATISPRPSRTHSASRCRPRATRSSSSRARSKKNARFSSSTTASIWSSPQLASSRQFCVRARA
jgi:class 3 adenylate cyclase